MTYYCSKRPKSKTELYPHQPEACNGRSQSPDLPDPATDDLVKKRKKKSLFEILPEWMDLLLDTMDDGMNHRNPPDAGLAFKR